MKYLNTFLLILLPVWAMSQGESIDLEKLKAPTSPASTIIGIQPSEISRPKSVKDLELSIYNNFSSDNSSFIPNDYALEVMPYWMFNQKNIDEMSYLNNTGWRSGWSNLSVSIATSTAYKLADTVNSNAIGVGVRTLLYRSKMNDKARKLTNQIYLNRNNEQLNSLIYGYIKRAKDEGIDMGDFNSVKNFIQNSILKSATDTFRIQAKDKHKDFIGFPSIKDLQRSLDAQFELLAPDSASLSTDINWKDQVSAIRGPLEVQCSVDSLEENLTDYLTNRQGFQLEMAGAVSVNFPTNAFDYSRVPQWGIWFTGTYQEKESSVLQYLAMVRYIRNDVEFYRQFEVNDSINSSDALDFGGKFVLFPSKKFTAEFEGTARYQSKVVEKAIVESNMKTETETETETGWNYRWLLNVNYQIKPDLVLTYSFGKDFDPLFTVNGNVISSLGISFGFGNPTISEPK